MRTRDEEGPAGLDRAFVEVEPPPDGLATLRRTLSHRVARRAARRRRAVVLASSCAAVVLGWLAWPAPVVESPPLVAASSSEPVALDAVGPGHPLLDPPSGQAAVLRGPGVLVRLPTSRPDVVLYDLR